MLKLETSLGLFCVGFLLSTACQQEDVTPPDRSGAGAGGAPLGDLEARRRHRLLTEETLA